MQQQIVYQNDTEFPLKYPFDDNKIPDRNRLSISDIPDFLISDNLIEDVFPHVKSNLVAYVSGVEMDKWSDLYECLYIYCCEFNIPNMVFIWSNNDYVRVIINEKNWRKFLPLPDNFLNILIENFNVGVCIPLIGVSVRSSLECYLTPCPYQIFVSPTSGKTNSSISKFIPPFNHNNIPAFDIINERNLKVYCHASLSTNMAKYNHSKYISDLLVYCTGHGIKGVVFHVGSNKDIPYEQAKQMMLSNIINGINGAKFREDQTGTAKFLLETPSGKGNEMLSNIYDFIRFCLEVQSYPGIRDNFSICIDTCHVHQSGVSPYAYLTEVLKYLPVDLIHFNDSNKDWGCRRDLHSRPGEGKINWIYLMKVAQICKILNISMIFEN